MPLIAQVVDDMSYTMSWPKSFRCYEKLWVVVDINDSRSCAQGSWCYEQLSVVDDMSQFMYEQLKALDAMNSSGLWLT